MDETLSVRENISHEYSNIEVKVNKENLSQEKKDLLEEVIRFAREGTDIFKNEVDQALQRYKEGRGSEVLTDEIIRKFIEKDYDLPEFKILDGVEANKLLFEIDGIDEGDPNANIWKLEDDELLVVFNLSKPLARFWYKGPTENPPTHIEWGNFYYHGKEAVWSHAGEEILHGKLNLDRRNDAGQHDSKKYSYVWTAKIDSNYKGQ